MAKYTITHTCGCATEAVLFGKMVERERRIAAMERRECPSCVAKASDLNGSPKQVAWAMDIRNSVRMAIAEARSNSSSWFERRKLGEDLEALFFGEFDKLASEIMANKSAKWWIENGQRLNVHGLITYPAQLAVLRSQKGN